MRTEKNRQGQSKRGMWRKQTAALAVWTAALVLMLSLAGCTQTAPAASSEAGTSAQADATAATQADTSAVADTAQETRIFTDSVGRKVELPAQIERVALSGPMAQIVVFSLAPEKLVGIATEWDKSAAEYLDTDYYQLPVIGQLYGGKGELNLEELLRVDPQVVIDVGEPKGSIVEDLDGLQEQTGIPFVHITATLSTMPEAYTLLGELLGMEAEAAERADYCRAVYDNISGKAAGLTKKKVLFITGEEGLGVIAKDSFHAEVIDLLADNAAVVDEPSSKGTGNEVDMEQILQWNPEVILFAPESIYDRVAELEEWQASDAIQNGAYYEVPFGPHNWMGFQPSVQRYLGLQWMMTLLYPEEADYDLYAQVAEYYRLFYHCELTEEQYEALVANSILKDAQ